MNYEKVEKLIKLAKENDVKKFKFKDFDSEIELDFTEDNGYQQPLNNIQQHSGDMKSNNDSVKNKTESQYQEIKSPMVGTFFLQDEKELTNPVIEVGDEINKGDIIGYIEAMKVMNEITSDVSGVVEEILVQHGTNVEYNQVIVNVK
ncbi:biotin carboxyl carrier protein of acetyl-CoA carboxylase [Staphylococcus caeli]|uniref:Biotin carboxyl carrier protein of acetyl-CoA carboxylase n=1 Tax=Staphylococcus caeli TaxID=2201815 RepID=A0A1D4QX94_9STAP|nr:biotin/lipoyl-containing protein [Staphylococcus caeli]SCS25716.1 biotin carboxyl carrier protein of acetyl-CoA carboxylase [Staphylococcus caeli]SCT39770.1 biotin carboxyl carrier protein of acetyl-CoA carboxylase [Staphylococcus caeli]